MTLTSYTKHTNNSLTQNPLLQVVFDLHREQTQREIAALSSASDIIDELEARKFRPVLGGLPPLKAYMLKLDLTVCMVAWRHDDYIERAFYKYKSRSPELKDATIEAAKEQFLENVSLSEYEGCGMEIFETEVASHVPLLDVPMRQLPIHTWRPSINLLSEHDEDINTRPNQCVISGLLSMLWNEYKKLTPAKLIEQLGTDTPCLDEIEAWISNTDLPYCDYVSLYIVDPLNNLILCHIAQKNTKVKMTYQLNNHHLYTITDEKWRKQMQYLGRVEIQAVKSPKLHSDNYVYCDDADEIPRHPGAPFILCDESNLSTLADNIHSETKTMINNLAFEGHRVVMIQHPVTKQIILSATQYHERKLVADTLLKIYKYTGFEFMNQSFCKLAVSSFKVLQGELPVDTYGPHQIGILEEFPINPVICKTEHFPHERDRVVSIDMRRSYTSILLNNNDVIPVFSYSDKKEVWDPKLGLPIGEYYIDIPIIMANGTLHQRHGWYPLTFVKYCLKQQYIKQENIKFVMKASGFLSASTFRAWAETVTSLFGKHSKHLINHFVGWLGIQFTKTTEAAMTNCVDTAVGTELHYTDGSVNLYTAGDCYFIKRTRKVRRYRGHAFAHRHILAANIVQLDKMYLATTKHVSHTVLGWNTDSVKLALWTTSNPVNVKAKDDCVPGEYYIEEECKIRGKEMYDIVEQFTTMETEDTVTSTWKTATDSQTSGLILGMGGTGKTFLLGKEIKALSKQKQPFVVLTYTCASCDRVQCECQSQSNIQTFDSFFHRDHSWSSWIDKASKKKYIFVDEFSLVPKRFWHILYVVKQLNPDIVFRIFGDERQCHPMEHQWVEYLDCELFRCLVDHNKQVLPYRPGSCRYDEPLYNAIVEFWKTGKIPAVMRTKVLRSDTRMSMCLSHGQTRETENAKQAAAWKTGQCYFIDGKRFAQGMPIIAFAKVKSANVVNNQRFTFKSATDNTVTLTRNKSEFILTRATFTSSFRHGFCDSVFRHQGYTVGKPYNILDVDKMSKQDFYTAITRFESLDSFGLDCTDWDREFVLARPSAKSMKFEMTKPNLEVAYIYRISDDRGYLQYVGYTTRSIEERYAEHLTDPTSSKMHDCLITTPTKVELLKTIHYLKIKEVTDIEADYIKQIPFDKTMNTNHASTEPAKYEACSFHTVSPYKPSRQWPKISDQPKYKRWRIQWRADTKVKSKTFSYKSGNRADSLQAAEQFRWDQFS